MYRSFDLSDIVKMARELFMPILEMALDERIDVINSIKQELHAVSPFIDEPIDCVQWVSADRVLANDYNPNSVAPPEFELLRHSISEDGYTQPIVSWQHDDIYEVVDGFHRTRVGKEDKAISDRIQGYLPLSIINGDREDRNDRIASTIRHNRARGKHAVEAMSDIVMELKRRNWSNSRIGKELGMDEDEVLRLAQITGLMDMFANREFSESWESIGKNNLDVSELEDDQVDLDWMKPRRGVKPGWDHRTETYSVLYGDDGQHLGIIQKSRFNDEWFCYSYIQPPVEDRKPAKDAAMEFVEKSHA
jgi:ParB-like chromosome segregation protein Spo0J